tara:strand:- start:1160 stop:1786 length:627 start_codon:yes stop_codon:yes gene_type:complete
MEIVKIRSITPNPDNPRLIKNEKYKLLLHSVKVSPAFMLMNPIKVDLDNMILGGNMRYKACMELKKKEVPIEVFTREHAEINNKARREEGIKEATYEEQCREYIIKDNMSFGEHDWDVLANEWNEVELNEWGLDVWQPEEDVDYSILDDEDLSGELQGMTDGVKKAIQIEFNSEHYEEASELVKFWRQKEAYIGGMIMEYFKSEKDKL